MIGKQWFLSAVVYPACAGIHPGEFFLYGEGGRLPRMRGDPPVLRLLFDFFVLSTPHARGSTLWSWTVGALDAVYPACAGIHPSSWTICASTICLPRMRGDPPLSICGRADKRMSTPHARGSTSSIMATVVSCLVYPACAGIHLCPALHAGGKRSLPRMRGDPPQSPSGRPLALRSTPHARGSTRPARPLGSAVEVYPACAGIHRCVRS